MCREGRGFCVSSPLTLSPPPPHTQDFPYNFTPDIRHYNVWCTRPLPPDELASVISRHAPAATDDTLCFVNPAALASIPSVWHAHVLVRERKENE